MDKLKYSMRHSHILTKNNQVKNDSLEKIVYLVAFAAPVFELPQLITILQRHSAKDVSLITWGFFALASAIWLVYAIRHKLKPLIISYLLFTTVETLTLGAIIFYHH